MDAIRINQDSGQKTWLTPRWILDMLGHFDCDPCCPEEMPWKTADVMYTPQEDGLKMPWFGRVWLNPPYGREAKPFIEKMVVHSKQGGHGISLIFVRPETKLWQDTILQHCDSIFFVRGRIRFCDINGKEADCATMPSALIAWTPQDTFSFQHLASAGFGLIVKPHTETI